MTPKQTHEFLNSPAETERRSNATKLKAFGDRRQDYYLYEDLAHWFADAKNRALRVPAIAAAKGVSVINRALDATAMIYDRHATRHVTDRDEAFQLVLEECDADDVMRGLDRALLLYEDVLVIPRVVDGELRLELVTPDRFAAVPREADPTTLESIAVACAQPIKPTTDTPAWRIYTRTETYEINAKGDVVSSEPNPLGDRWPVLLCSAQPASVRGRLLAESPSADLLSADTAQSLLTIFAMKEAKSSTHLLAVTGDASAATLGQTADTETELFLPEGCAVNGIARGVDFTRYADLSTKIVDDALASRGIAPAVARLADASSGEAHWQRRIPLTELRLRRVPLLRRIEIKLWTLVSAILEALGDPRAYGMAGFTIDYVEPAEPLTEMDSLRVFQLKRQLFLKTTIDELIDRNPDLDEGQAIEALRVIVERETARVGLTKNLAQLNSGVSVQPGDLAPTNSVGADPTSNNTGE